MYTRLKKIGLWSAIFFAGIGSCYPMNGFSSDHPCEINDPEYGVIYIRKKLPPKKVKFKIQLLNKSSAFKKHGGVRKGKPCCLYTR